MTRPLTEKSSRPGLAQLRRGCQGTSLLESMVAIVIIGIVIYAAMIYYGNFSQMRKSLAVATSNNEVDQALQGALIDTLRNNACMNPQQVFQNVAIGSFGSMSYANKLNINISGVGTLSPEALQPWRLAAKRCQQPRLNQGGAGSYYFCVRFVPRGGQAEKGTFMASQRAFAEIFIDTRNLQTGQPISCNTFNSSPEVAGGRVYYTTYWASSGGDGAILKQQTAGFYLGR